MAAPSIAVQRMTSEAADFAIAACILGASSADIVYDWTDATETTVAEAFGNGALPQSGNPDLQQRLSLSQHK
eukprot:1048408-Amphidinium_carterae.2